MCDVKTQRDHIMEELQRRGKRITKQRLLMLDVILEGNWSSCKEIYYEVARRDSTVGKATVYRMVGVLEEIGVLNRHPHIIEKISR